MINSKPGYVEVGRNAYAFSNSNLPTATFTMVHLAGPEDKYCCSACKSCHVDIYDYEGKKYIACLDCGHEEVYEQKSLNKDF